MTVATAKPHIVINGPDGTSTEFDSPAGFTEFELISESLRRGYRFEQADTDTETIVKMIRPDGTVAMTARKAKP